MNTELIKAIGSLLDERLEPIKADIDDMKTDVNGMKADIDGMKTDINEMKTDINGMKTDINGMKTDINGMKTDITNLNIRLESVESKTDNNTIILEDINKKVKTLAEVQSSFQDQLGRAKDNDDRTLTDRLEVIELAVKDTSTRVKHVQKDLVRVVKATGENWAEIIELKSLR